jgi:hypothetical protein
MAIVDTLQVVLELAADRAIASLRAFDKQLSFAHASFKKFASDISVQSQISAAAFLKGFTGITDWLTGASPTFQAYMDVIGFEFTNLGETIASDVQPQMDAFMNSLDGLITDFQSLPDPVRSAISLAIVLAASLGALSAVITLLSPLFSSLAGIFGWVAGIITGTVLPAISGLVTALGAGVLIAVLALVIGAVIGLKDAFDKNLGWALLVVQSFSAGVGAMFLGLTEFVGGLWTALTSLLTGNTQGFIDGVQGMVRGLITFLLGAVLTAASIITGFFLGLGTTLKSILTVFWDIGSGIVGAIVKGITDTGSQIASAIWDAIPSPVRAAIQGAGSFAGGIASGVASMIPHLAEGGIVSSPTVALIGERGPEAVVPLNQAGGMGGTTIGPIYISGSMNTDQDLQDLARRLMQYIHQETSAYNMAFGTKR